MSNPPSIVFSEAKFLKACLEEKEFPKLYIRRDTFYPEVAIIGRSNAGKSSLINHLTQKKDLVHVSSTPGKTQTINFFNINDQFLLIDLPGYGFAKIQKELKKTWGERLSLYLENRPQLKLLILILDLRRDLSDEDKQMIKWARFHQKEILFVFSKSDKFTDSQKKQEEKRLSQSLKEFLNLDAFHYLSYSIKDNQCRLPLRDFITQSILTL